MELNGLNLFAIICQLIMAAIIIFVLYVYVRFLMNYKSLDIKEKRNQTSAPQNIDSPSL